ncbi:MAG: Rieske (2Fe-2S) protein [Elusimicrobiales bacterium]
MGTTEEVAKLSELPEGRLFPVFPKGLPVLLARVGAEVFAVENRCAHMGCPLSAGKLEGLILQCPCHDWRFDLREGKFLDAPELSIRKYEVEIREGKIFARLP